MKPFPFSPSEWQSVEAISRALANAALADDHVLRAALFQELLNVLEELRGRYGDHPVLRETEADFCDDYLSQVELYRQAIRLAEDYNLPTLSIRLSLASILLQEINDPSLALSELNACKPELAKNADASQMQEWAELMKQCTISDGQQ